MIICQVCAYANWPDESFEVWRWYNYDKDFKQIVKEMRSLFIYVYSNIAVNKNFEDLKRSAFRIGTVYPEEAHISRSKIIELFSTLRYGWYKGYCLDMEKLHYFVREKTISQGWVKVKDVEKPEAYVIELGEKNSEKAYSNLKITKFTKENPKRLLMDGFYRKLGSDWNYLFERKIRLKF